MFRTVIFATLLVVMSTAPAQDEPMVPADENYIPKLDPADDEIRKYRLTILSNCDSIFPTDESLASPDEAAKDLCDDEVPIEGSIAYDSAYDSEDDGYVHISSITPYEVTVEGLDVIAIVHSQDADRMFYYELRMNGHLISLGGDIGKLIVGHNFPRRGSGFSASD